jgi:hypothetical protein
VPLARDLPAGAPDHHEVLLFASLGGDEAAGVGELRDEG